MHSFDVFTHQRRDQWRVRTVRGQCAKNTPRGASWRLRRQTCRYTRQRHKVRRGENELQHANLHLQGFVPLHDAALQAVPEVQHANVGEVSQVGYDPSQDSTCADLEQMNQENHHGLLLGGLARERRRRHRLERSIELLGLG